MKPPWEKECLGKKKRNQSQSQNQGHQSYKQKGKGESMKENKKEQPQRKEKNQQTLLFKKHTGSEIFKERWPEIISCCRQFVIMRTDCYQ